MENLEFNLEEAFNEIRSRMKAEGAASREEYVDLIDEVLEEKREEGLLDDDFNFKEAHEALEARWNEIEDEATDGGGEAEDEQTMK
ncbi:MAG: hypothetical protein V1778_01470 [bacterium]